MDAEEFKSVKDKWDEISYEQREIATQFIFLQLNQAIDRKGVSFRKLIYDYLEFEPKSYTPLFLAGGMCITNFIVEGCDYVITGDNPDENV